MLAAVNLLLLTDYLRIRAMVESRDRAEFDHVIMLFRRYTRLCPAGLATGDRFHLGVTREVQGLDRLLTYRQVLEEAGLSDNRRFEVHCSDQMKDAYQAAYTLLQSEDRPTALLTINDMLAIPVMRAAGDLGLTIPGDLSVAGFDDIPFRTHAPADNRFWHGGKEWARCGAPPAQALRRAGSPPASDGGGC